MYRATVYSINVRPQTASIVEGALDRHRAKLDRMFLRKDAVAMQPGSDYDDLTHAILLPEEGSILVEQR
jgi:hypothetical protein